MVVYQVHLIKLDLIPHLETKVIKVIKAKMAQPRIGVIKDTGVIKVIKVTEVIKVIKVMKVTKGIKDT